MLSNTEIESITNRLSEKIANQLSQPPLLLTQKELTNRTTLSRSTIYRYVKKEVIPVVRVGRRLLFEPDAVLKALSMANREMANAG